MLEEKVAVWIAARYDMSDFLIAPNWERVQMEKRFIKEYTDYQVEVGNA